MVQSGLKSKIAVLKAKGKALVSQGFNWERDYVLSQRVLVKNPNEHQEVQCDTDRYDSKLTAAKWVMVSSQLSPAPGKGGLLCQKLSSINFLKNGHNCRLDD